MAEIRRGDASLGGKELYSSAIRIGRDHVAFTVNTLVLAYVGAALALMLFFYHEGRSLSQVPSRAVVAIEIVRMLIGSIGIVLCAITTAACPRSTRRPPKASRRLCSRHLATREPSQPLPKKERRQRSCNPDKPAAFMG